MNGRFLIPKALILGATVYAVIRMWHWAIGFTMFTQLSNLFAALAVAVQLALRVGGRAGEKAAAVKFAATVSVLVTFLVYLIFLGPATGGGLIEGYREDGYASLCLHLITPLLMLLDFLLNDAAARPWGFRDASFALLPPIGYFITVLAMGALGFRWFGMVAPYPFLNYAAPCGWFGFMPETASRATAGIGVFYVMVFLIAVFLLVAWLLTLAARLASGKRRAG